LKEALGFSARQKLQPFWEKKMMIGDWKPKYDYGVIDYK